MILLAHDVDATLPRRLSWETTPAAIVSGSEAWLRASRHQMNDLRDEHGHRIPLRQELWVALYPPRDDNVVWRVECDQVALGVVGRGPTADSAMHDWRLRFRAMTQRFLEMRPFEMTDEDKAAWKRLQTVVDVPRYKATKPMTVRQIGAILGSRPGRVVVRWEDGVQEKVDPGVFDEMFARFKVGQLFEAKVTRSPLTFRIIRADAVRRLPKRTVSADRSEVIWNRAVHPEDDVPPPAEAEKLDEAFWLQPPP
jgi:hypothetical protein